MISNQDSLRKMVRENKPIGEALKSGLSLEAYSLGLIFESCCSSDCSNEKLRSLISKYKIHKDYSDLRDSTWRKNARFGNLSQSMLLSTDGSSKMKELIEEGFSWGRFNGSSWDGKHLIDFFLKEKNESQDGESFKCWLFEKMAMKNDMKTPLFHIFPNPFAIPITEIVNSEKQWHEACCYVRAKQESLLLQSEVSEGKEKKKGRI